MRTTARVGARVVVPLGRSLTTGYIVNLIDTFQADTGMSESDLKEVREVLDRDPLVIPEVLRITQWVSEYYSAPWGEVIKAALPPGISANIEQYLKITPEGRTHLEALSEKPSSGVTVRALQLVGDAVELRLSDLAAALGKAQASRAVRELQQ